MAEEVKKPQDIVEIESADRWGLNLFTSSISDTQEELQRRVLARKSYITLLEKKYNANFNIMNGQFIKQKEDSHG